MDQPQTFRVYKGNHIILIGMPLIIVAIDRPGDDYGQTEFYLFVLKQPDGLHYVARKIKFDGIPRTVMSDDLLLNRSLDCADAELENYLQARRIELKDLVASDCSFELKQVEAETFLYYVVSRKLFEMARAIRNGTNCAELEQFLKITADLKQSSIIVSDNND